MKVTAVLKSRIGAQRISFRNLEDREVVYSWNKENNFTLEVPTKIVYKNQWGQDILIYENFAQHLLDDIKDLNASSPTYGQNSFELVEAKEAPVVEQKVTVVDKSKKEKKDEKNK